MNPFKSKGFDSLIAKGLQIEGTLTLAPASVTQLDGIMRGDSIRVDSSANEGKVNSTTLVVNGVVIAIQSICVPNVTITGEVTCDLLVVSGILAIKKGARINCKHIEYNTLIVETGAIINGQFEHIISRVPMPSAEM